MYSTKAQKETCLFWQQKIQIGVKGNTVWFFNESDIRLWIFLREWVHTYSWNLRKIFFLIFLFYNYLSQLKPLCNLIIFGEDEYISKRGIVRNSFKCVRAEFWKNSHLISQFYFCLTNLINWFKEIYFSD